MQKQIINPWTWQDRFGFVQGAKVKGASGILFCAGLVSVGPQGEVLHPGDMEKQISQALDNLETLLDQAGANLANVARLTYYTTDVAAFSSANPLLVERLAKGSCRAVSTLLGVAALFHPECVVEIEATAVL